MGLAIVYSRAQVEIDAPEVRVEVHLSGGLPRIFIVGLPEAAVKESRDRVRSALINSGFSFPASRITISLAPADLPKDGSRFDLAIALGILAASAQIPKQALDGYEFIGELSLAGELRPVSGILPTALAATRKGRKLIIPEANQDEAGLLNSDDVFCAASLLNVVAGLLGRETLSVAQLTTTISATRNLPDLKNVCGQQHAIRALTVAASGAHNLLFIGPPGSGKTLLASCMPGILPGLTKAEALEVMAIRSVAGKPFDASSFKQPPFQNPHHTASAVAMVGGGSKPRPGEISLAHCGALFLDELPEFPRQVLEVLREPLESGQIVISRAARQSTYPAQFQLLAAMNPCPCGFSGDRDNNCRCSREQIVRYRQRISGPLLDRIDMQVEVPRLALGKLKNPEEYSANSTASRKQVSAARVIQIQRQGCVNAQLCNEQLQDVCQLQPSDQDFLIQTCEQLHLSARAYTRILRLARSIADMATEADIQTQHLAEAIAYRRVFNTHA
ncbi:MAG: YifB family Mg chelatase-like AAA ATPase [Xanthomonadales bacterium]|nr:YifB family Mg chelatase-like AAA ATPase [Xanthomonadales bacterium]